MRNRIISILLLGLGFFCLAGVAAAQTPPAPSNTFSLNAYAVALPGSGQTLPGTLTVAGWNFTPNFGLRETNLLSQPVNGYFGGEEYRFPSLSKGLNNASPYLNGNQFQFYETASAGIVHINGTSAQHYAFLGGGGVRYDPTGTGKFTITLVEAQYAKLPGYKNNTAIIASGIGTTPQALATAPLKAVKALAKKL